jgi:hypothetical protein
MVSLVALLAIGSSALAWTEDFEGNPDVTAAPWAFVYGSANVATPTAPNTSNLSMNHPDFTIERLDLTHPSVNESTPTGYVEFDYYHGSGGQRFFLRNSTGWSMAMINVWGNGGGADAEVSLMSSTWVVNAQVLDVIPLGSWNRMRIDWDAPNESISVALNGAPLAGLQNVAAMEPGYGGYATESVTRFDSYAWTGTQGLNQIDNIGVNEPAPAFVPEPATLALLGLGGLYLRRRKKA